MKTITTPKIKIRNEYFLGEFKIEDYLQNQIELLLEKYKAEGYKDIQRWGK